MNSDTSQDSLDRHHQPNQGTPPDHQDQGYFGERAEVVHMGGHDGLKLAVIALLIIGATSIGLALIFRSVDKSADASPSHATSAIAEHNKLMREAMNMAREAQAMNRQRMMEMQQAMEETQGYAEYGDSPGADGSSDP